MADGYYPLLGKITASFAVGSGYASVGGQLGAFLLPTLIGDAIQAALLIHAPVAERLNGPEPSDRG
jgi:hypothetical protein